MDNQEFRRRVFTHLTEKGVPNECPACGVSDWALGHVVKFSVLGASSWYPFLPQVCANCGFTYWFNAFYVGFTDEEIDEMQESGPPQEPITPEEIESLRLEAEQ